ncbi:MAG TPA: hypothetical protein VF131_03905 [Blastocatellia bacterium]|nr:hypothetical protein [Blastocatellia bacterium]
MTTMIAGHITVIGREMTTDRVVIASGNSGVSSVLETTTAGISAATEEEWMICTEEAVAMTTAEISAALGERGLEKQVMTGAEIGEGIAIAIE